MTGDELKRHMQTVLPLDALERLAREFGVIERDRRLDVVQLVIALVLNGGTHEGGRQFDVLRRYLESGAPRVVRGAFYSWFTAPLESLLRELLGRAITVGQAQPPLLPGILRHRRDWRIFDSTTIKLPNSADLMLEYPGAGDYAAIKVHKEFSVGTGNLVAYEFSPARNHDSPFLRIDESRRGTGLLIDMGYASLARLIECETFDVHYVMRLKDDWKPTVDRLVRGAISKEVAPDVSFDVLLDNETIRLDGRAVDADVTLGRGKQKVQCRLVGISSPKGYCFFITNIPRATHGPKQVGDLYRIRWEIETDNKVDKAGARLDEVSAKKPVSVHILLLASLLNTTIARTIVQSEKISARRNRAASEKTIRPPLHPILLIRAMAAFHGTIARLLLEPPVTLHAGPNWDSVMTSLRHLGHDPNWRRRPSVLDTIQGLSAPPARARSAKARA